MKITTVFVQAEDGVPAHEAFYKAWHGFRQRGLDCHLVESAEIEAGALPLDRMTLVAGGLRTVESAMQQLGMPVPIANNLPVELQPYFGRRIDRSTLGQIREEWKEPHKEPCFIKPLKQNKGFPGIALFHPDDLSTLAHLPDVVPILRSNYVLFESEWRVFVCHQEIIGMSHYQGDCFCYPDRQVIEAALRDFTSAPAGYGIDFGILSNGRTVIVEVNDGYSLGSFSLNSVDYTMLLEARWTELAV